MNEDAKCWYREAEITRAGAREAELRAEKAEKEAAFQKERAEDWKGQTQTLAKRCDAWQHSAESAEARVKELEQHKHMAHIQIGERDARVAELEAENARLEQHVAELEGRTYTESEIRGRRS